MPPAFPVSSEVAHLRDVGLDRSECLERNGHRVANHIRIHLKLGLQLRELRKVGLRLLGNGGDLIDKTAACRADHRKLRVSLVARQDGDRPREEPATCHFCPAC
jgi:hypothetical protein